MVGRRTETNALKSVERPEAKEEMSQNLNVVHYLQTCQSGLKQVEPVPLTIEEDL
jgi:hypothetical protein